MKYFNVAMDKFKKDFVIVATIFTTVATSISSRYLWPFYNRLDNFLFGLYNYEILMKSLID